MAHGEHIMRNVLRTSFAVAWLILFPTFASAQTELTIFVSGAMTQPVRESGDAFTRTGAKLVYIGDTTGGLVKRLTAGEKVDVIVVDRLCHGHD